MRSRQAHGLAAAFVALSLLLSACQDAAPTAKTAAPISTKDGSGQSIAPATTPKAATTPAVLDVTPANRALNVLPNSPVVVKASSGTLGDVTLVGPSGKKIAGLAGPDGVWKSTDLLQPSASYSLTVAATGPDGFTSKTKTTFRTLKPRVSATYGLIPNGGIVGVGMPAIVQFDSPVATKAERAQVEKLAKVTSVPAQRGAWGWLDNRQLMWRPATFWKAGTKVTLTAPLHGVQTGEGKWITGDDQTSFTVGSSMISSVNMKSHTMTVARNGKVIRTIPVSTGRPGPKTETRYGTKIIIERNAAIVMDSATVGIPKGSPNYYKINTKWNLRVTWTGEFLHSAPWSVNAQGSQNVSHGCTNMAPGDAQWMFDNSKMGDVVKFTGSSRAFEPTDGIGVWAFPSFAAWKAQSALV